MVTKAEYRAQARALLFKKREIDKKLTWRSAPCALRRIITWLWLLPLSTVIASPVRLQ